MRLFFILLTLFIIGCGGDDTRRVFIDDTNEDGSGGNTIGAGIDPGKNATTCYPAFADDELNVVTWNIEWFPKNGGTTVGKVKEIIEDLDADIIAVQEIAETSQFVALASAIPGWEAAYSDVRYDQEIGFLYKKDAFTSFGVLSQLFGSDSYAFPRQAVKVDVTHASGLEVTFLSVHLKCCKLESGSAERARRQAASEKIKSYIDSNLSNKAVIVLGDFNDYIDISNGPFQNFKDDSNYLFTDQAIADGNSSNWSYSSYPSHLDHILISDELFGMVRNVQTVKPESCVSSYSSTVSDHRPVLASFK